MALGHVLNYPNPFSTNTKFFIEHNRNGNALMVQVKVYSVSGKLVKTLQDNFFAEGNLYCDLEWMVWTTMATPSVVGYMSTRLS